MTRLKMMMTNSLNQSYHELQADMQWTDRRAAGNMGLASCGVKCLNSSAVFQINFSAGLTVLCPEIPHERQAQKRCRQHIFRTYAEGFSPIFSKEI